MTVLRVCLPLRTGHTRLSKPTASLRDCASERPGRRQRPRGAGPGARRGEHLRGVGVGADLDPQGRTYRTLIMDVACLAAISFAVTVHTKGSARITRDKITHKWESCYPE